MAVWNGEEQLRTAAIFLAWASLVALGIAWDAYMEFRRILDAQLPDERDMAPVWQQRSHRWWSIGQLTFGISILLFVAWTIGWTAF